MSTLRVNNMTNVGGTGPTYVSGGIIQVLQTFKPDNYMTNSTSFVDVPGMSVTITPKSANSKILVLIDGTVGNGHVSYGTRLNLVRNGTNIAQSTTGTVAQQTMQIFSTDNYATNTVSISYLDSPATTSAVTYKLQLCSFNSASYSAWNRQPTGDGYPNVSSITLMEVAA